MNTEISEQHVLLLRAVTNGFVEGIHESDMWDNASRTLHPGVSDEFYECAALGQHMGRALRLVLKETT